MLDTDRTKATLGFDEPQWIDQYTRQARDHVQGLRDDPDTDPKRLDGAEAMLEIIDTDFSPASADAGIEGGEITIESEAEYMWPPHE